MVSMVARRDLACRLKPGSLVFTRVGDDWHYHTGCCGGHDRCDSGAD